MQATTRRIQRSRDERVIAGVAAGIAERLAIDPLWVRLLWVLLALLGGGGVVLYLAAWAIMPDSDGRHSLAPVGLALALIGLPVLLALLWLVPVTVTTSP